MMKKVRKLATTFIAVAMAFATVGANITMQKTYADETSLPDEPRAGDLIWITDEMVTYNTPDKMFDSNVSAKIQYEIYIIDRYDEDNWRVHVPMLNEPERVLLLPVDGYNITVISHNNYVIGDLTRDNRVDAFDMILLRQAMFRDFNLDDYSDIDGLMDRSIDRQLADVNDDSKVSVADLVCMQSFLLGRTKSLH